MIAVGKIGKSVGLKGEVKVVPLTDHLDRFQTLQEVSVGEDEHKSRKYSIQSVRVAGGHVVMKLSGIDSRTDADALREKILTIPDDLAVKRSPDEYFVHELIGMTVKTDEGVVAGVIQDILQLPAGDTWVIQNGSKEILIPGVKEFIRLVDLENRQVLIHVIEGLLD